MAFRCAQLKGFMFIFFLLAAGAGIIIGLTVAQEDVILKARSWPGSEELSAEWHRYFELRPSNLERIKARHH